MSEHEHEPDADDVEELRRRLDELHRENEELKQASSGAERREAREDVDEAEDAFVKLGRKLGLDPETIRKSVAAAKDEEDYQRFRKHADRYYSEQLVELEQEEAREEEERKAEQQRKRAADRKKQRAETEAAGDDDDPEPEEQQPDADEPPVREHWSERMIRF